MEMGIIFILEACATRDRHLVGSSLLPMLEHSLSTSSFEAASLDVHSSHVTGPAPISDASERRVVRQLVEALLFERLVDYTIAPSSSLENASGYEPVFDTCVDFSVGAAPYRCMAAFNAFSRVRVAPGSVQRLVGYRFEEASLLELVSALPIGELAKQRLVEELVQTLDLCRWNASNLPRQHISRREMGFRELESAIVEGHLYHPCFKSRTGFTLLDHQTYSPEVGNTFQLQWWAIARKHVRSTLPCDPCTFWQEELGAETFSVLTSSLQRQSKTWADYFLVPVHPWQAKRALQLDLGMAIRRGEIVDLGSAGDLYQASQSLRTLINVSRPGSANVKLPLNIVCTSTRRNLRPPFVCTAPLLSDWLTLLVQTDPFLQAGGRVVLLREYAGILYEPPTEHASANQRQDGVEGVIGAIYRESVQNKLEPGESAVPFTALMLMEGDNRPFIADWLATHGTQRWVERLIEVMLIPIWHLLVHHGIAFESHAQNLVLIHVRGWPRKIVLRDFHEDTEYVPDYLSRPELVPDFSRVEPSFASIPDDDGYRMASTDALRELFMDTVYVYNLAELSFLLERHGSFTEERFWDVVRSQLQMYAQSGITEQTRITRLGCDSPEVVVESLLKKKFMNGDVLDFFEHTVPNPLRS